MMKTKILNERLEHDGLLYLGTEANLDLYRVTTYDALNSVSVDGGNNTGGIWTNSSADTFNSNITDNLRLYIIVNSEDKARWAVILSNSESPTYWNITYNINQNFNVDLKLNVCFEGNTAHTLNTISNDPDLLHLLSHADAEIKFKNMVSTGFITSIDDEHTLIYVKPDLLENETNITVPNTITKLKANCFYDVINKENVVLNIPETVISLEDNAGSIFNNVSATINFAASEEDVRNLFADNNLIDNLITSNKIHFNLGRSPEELRAIETERIRREEERIEQLKNEFAEKVNAIENPVTFTARTKEGLEQAFSYLNSLPENIKEKIDADLINKLNEIQAEYNRLKQEHDDRVNLNKFRYKLNKGEAQITHINTKSFPIINGTITIDIPSTLNGKSVTSIEPYAFTIFASDNLERLILRGGENLKEIKNYAFNFYYKPNQASVRLNKEIYSHYKSYKNSFSHVREPELDTWETENTQEGN